MYTSDTKAIWKYSTDRSANLRQGAVTLSVTPPGDAPVGKYSLSARTMSESATLGTLVVLFNPWCSGGVTAAMMSHWDQTQVGLGPKFYLENSCVCVCRGLGVSSWWDGKTRICDERGGSHLLGNVKLPPPNGLGVWAGERQSADRLLRTSRYGWAVCAASLQSTGWACSQKLKKIFTWWWSSADA